MSRLYDVIFSIRDLFILIYNYLTDQDVITCTVMCHKTHVKYLRWATMRKQYQVTDEFAMNTKQISRFDRLFIKIDQRSSIKVLKEFSNRVNKLQLAVSLECAAIHDCALLNDLPQGLKSLNLLHLFRWQTPFPADLLPPSLTELFLYYEDHEFIKGMFSPRLAKLKLFMKHQPFPVKLFPESLTELKLSTDQHFLLLDKAQLPPDLIHLELNGEFNQPLGDLRYLTSLRFLSFAYDFSQDLDVDQLPPGLETILFGTEFNRRISLQSNRSIATLAFGEDFDQSVDELPCNLKALTLGQSFNHRIDRLPSSLVGLYFEAPCVFNEPIKCLPSGLERLRFGIYFNQSLEAVYCLNRLRVLHLGFFFNQPIERLPFELEELSLGAQFNQWPPFLPKTLKVLSFDLLSRYNLPFVDPDLFSVSIRIPNTYPYSFCPLYALFET